LRIPEVNDSLSSQLEEFDVWITPELGEISDTERFKQELALLTLAFETLGGATEEFASETQCRPNAIAETLAKTLQELTAKERKHILDAVASALFAVTGKSDNNFKCQFPLFLRDTAHWRTMPTPGRKAAQNEIVESPIPRTLPSQRFMSIASRIKEPAVESRLLKQFLSFLLRSDNAVQQFWALGRSYFSLKELERHQDLLAPLAAYKVRASAMATAGHEPERLIREMLADWGMKPGVDFNVTDVLISGKAREPKAKTRAFDFVLPFKTPGWREGWEARLFIQCQFYAGDSGSVSHKNVDQTRRSRDSVLRHVEEPFFIEYVDDAGYFSSLNGDLKRLLGYEDTHGFFQIRSAPIRLRSYFEKLGFLPPIKREETVALGAATEKELSSALTKEGYSASVIKDCLKRCIESGNLHPTEGRVFAIAPDRLDIVRRHLLLGVAARESRTIARNQIRGKVLVPGYGPFSDVALDRLAEAAIAASPVFRDAFSNSRSLLADIRWLSDRHLRSIGIFEPFINRKPLVSHDSCF